MDNFDTICVRKRRPCKDGDSWVHLEPVERYSEFHETGWVAVCDDEFVSWRVCGFALDKTTMCRVCDTGAWIEFLVGTDGKMASVEFGCEFELIVTKLRHKPMRLHINKTLREYPSMLQTLVPQNLAKGFGLIETVAKVGSSFDKVGKVFMTV
eukprot:scaffold40739_cov183-Amphora_coffeaeformis.AAC.2